MCEPREIAAGIVILAASRLELIGVDLDKLAVVMEIEPLQAKRVIDLIEEVYSLPEIRPTLEGEYENYRIKNPHQQQHLQSPGRSQQRTSSTRASTGSSVDSSNFGQQKRKASLGLTEYMSSKRPTAEADEESEEGEIK